MYAHVTAKVETIKITVGIQSGICESTVTAAIGADMATKNVNHRCLLWNLSESAEQYRIARSVFSMPSHTWSLIVCTPVTSAAERHNISCPSMLPFVYNRTSYSCFRKTTVRLFYPILYPGDGTASGF